MIKRLIALLCLCASAWATTTVTGTIQNLGTGAIGSGTFVRFWLRGCNGNQPTVNGTAVIGPTLGNIFYFDVVPNSSGVISGTIYSTRDVTGNSGGDISCGGSTTAVWYGVQLFVNGKGGPETPVHAKNTATLDITQLSPISTTPVVTAPTGDGTYARLDATNTPFTGNVSISGTHTLTVGGALTAQSVGGVQYAAAYAPSSTTCGIQEAYNALPSNGGTIFLQNGNCTGTGWPVVIQKPVNIIGQGMGGTLGANGGAYSTITAGTVLINNTTGSDIFQISLGSNASLEGIVFRDFGMFGNKAVGGATAGNCVSILAGNQNTAIRQLSFQNISCFSPKGSGWLIQDNAFIIQFLNVQVSQSGSHCFINQNGSNNGVSSQIKFVNSLADFCGGTNGSFLPGTADGWNISGANQRAIEFMGSTCADSANGINVVNGATSTQIHVFNGDFETNSTADINLNDGFGHTVIASSLTGSGAVTGRGILTGFPSGANFANIQLLLFANSIQGHATQDVTIGANAHLVYILPQALNNYTYTDNSGIVVRTDINSSAALLLTALGGVIPTANGSYNLGGPSNGWLGLYSLRWFPQELTPATPQGGFDAIYADQTLHGIMHNDNNSVWEPLGTRAVLTSDWTCGTGGTVSSCVSATIIGSGGGVPMTFSLPLVANSAQLDCDFIVAQATGTTANGWNLLTATNGATNVTAYYGFPVNGATAPTLAGATYTTDQASTTTTFQIGGNWTLGALVGTAKYPVHIHAAIEAASASGTVLSVQLVAPTVGDLVTIYRGSGCWIHP